MNLLIEREVLLMYEVMFLFGFLKQQGELAELIPTNVFLWTNWLSISDLIFDGSVSKEDIACSNSGLFGHT